MSVKQDLSAKRAVSHGMKSEFSPSDEEADEDGDTLQVPNTFDELTPLSCKSVQSQELESAYGSSCVSAADPEDGSGTEHTEQRRGQDPAGHNSRNLICETEIRPRQDEAVDEIAKDSLGSQDGSESRGTELPQVPDAAGHRQGEAAALLEACPRTGIGEECQDGSGTGHTRRKSWRRCQAPVEWIRSHPWIILVVLALLVTLVVALGVSLAVCSGQREGQIPVYADTPHVLACPDDWIGYNGICYFLSRDHLSWDQAQARCSELGASLAVLRDEEMEFLFPFSRNVDYWLGLRRRDQRLQWGDGSSFSSSIPILGNAECVFLADGKLRSAVCSNEMQYLCSRAQTPQLKKMDKAPSPCCAVSASHLAPAQGCPSSSAAPALH